MTTSCTQRICCSISVITIVVSASVLAWYFLVFTKVDESQIPLEAASCNDCYCVPTTSSATDGEGSSCPSSLQLLLSTADETTTTTATTSGQVVPTVSVPESTINVWQSSTPINPSTFVGDCNPFNDGDADADVSTENQEETISATTSTALTCEMNPAIDLQMIQLGDMAVCGIHYESSPSSSSSTSLTATPDNNTASITFNNGSSSSSSSEVDIDTSRTFDATAMTDNSTTNVADPDMDAEDICRQRYGAEQQQQQQQQPGSSVALSYHLVTYSSIEEAHAAGAYVTHVGACGVCSSLQDLAVMANLDYLGQTSPGTFCRRRSSSTSGSKEESSSSSEEQEQQNSAFVNIENGLACYMDLGFTYDCAKLWTDASWYTARKCFAKCVLDPTIPGPFSTGGVEGVGSLFGLGSDSDIDTGNTTASDGDGSGNDGFRLREEDGCTPNDCVSCEDEYTTPIFLKYAGRTRKRSGLLSTTARPCSEFPTSLLQQPNPLQQSSQQQQRLYDPCPVTLPLV